MHPPTVPADEQKYMPQKHNYSHIFDRLPFSGEIEVPAFHPNGKKKLRNKMQVMETVSLEGGGRPNPSFIKKHHLDKNSEPQDWFNAFLPVFDKTHKSANANKNCFTHMWCEFTNNKAILMGAGQPRGLYPTWKPFTYQEIERHLALYFMQGLNPSPQVKSKFNHPDVNPIQDNALCY